MKELTKFENYAVYTEGKYTIVVDTKTKLVVDRFNYRIERFKENFRRAGLIALTSLVIIAPIISGVKHKSANLEARTTNISSHGLTFYPQEKEDMERLKSEDSIETSIDKTYKEICSIGIKVPEYINKSYTRATFFVESSDNPNIPSRKGARGYPQTYFSVWKEVFPKDSYKDFEEGVKNIKKSTEFVLRYYARLDQFNRENYPGYDSLSPEKKREILAAEYNAGPGTLENNDWNINGLSSETRNHVEKMKIAYQKFS